MKTPKWMPLLLIVFASMAPAAEPASQPVAAKRTDAQPGDHPLIGIYGGASNTGVTTAIKQGVDILMPSVYWYGANPWLKDLVRRVRPNGIRVYPSLAMAYDGYGEKQTEFARAHPEFWEKRRDGSRIDRGGQVGLSWGYPEVRAHKVDAVCRLVAATDVDGVLLDYTRYFGHTAGYSDIIVQEFRRAHGKDPLTLASDDPAWLRFRADYVTRFVAELRAALDHIRPGLRLIACVNPDPAETLKESMQDWGTWVKRGLVDGVVTMIYERDTNNTLKSVMIANTAIAGKVPHIPMIAPYGGNLITPDLLREGALKCLATGTGAVAFYREDSIVEHNLWDTVGEIANWDLRELSRRQVNSVLNAGFEFGLEQWAIGNGEGVAVITGSARSGSRCLRLVFPGRRAVRQVIDRGFLADRKGLHVAASINAPTLSPDADISLEVEVNTRDGHEELFRVPVKPTAGAGWRRTEATVPISNSNGLNFVAVSVVADAAAGEILIDDVHLALVDAASASGAAVRVTPPPRALAAGVGVNIARGQPVRSSSFWENGFESARAVDGNLSDADYGKGAAWHSQRPARDQWIVIHLPARYALTRIRLLNASAQSAYRTKKYRIETSLDDRVYRQIATGTLPDDGTTWTEVSVPSTPARFLRFTGVSGYNLDYAVGLKEIEVYAE